MGSYTAEALARAGIGKLTIVDNDTVSVTNINRQMPALASTVGQPKCDVVAARLQAINPAVRLVVKKMFITEENIPQLLAEYKYSFVVDAIDTLPSKAALIEACWQGGVKIVSPAEAVEEMKKAAERLAKQYEV